MPESQQPRVPTRNPGATLAGEAKRRYVTGMFARIAQRYDLMNTLMTFGRDARWRQLTVRVARPRPGTRALDMARARGASRPRWPSKGRRSGPWTSPRR